MQSEFKCEVCRVGLLHLKRTTYTSWSGDDLVILPNVPVWVCDVCGEYIYDPDTITRVEALLGVERSLIDADSPSDSASMLAHLAYIISGRHEGM